MPTHNADIAAVFGEIADLLEIEGANPFRIRAYRNAARTLSELPQEARVLLENGDDLRRLPGIGDDLAAKIAEIELELDSLRNDALCQWLLAAVLYGAPISEALASRTWREFAASGVLSP